MPDPSSSERRTALIADSHLGGPGGDGLDLVEQLAALPDDCERLVLLGDIFHVWVGSRKYETPEVRLLLPALDALRARGVRVDYVEGNRDFFLDGSPYESSLDSIVTELAFEADGQLCLAVHGDGLNDRDLKYRFWRWLSKSAPIRFLILALPAFAARRAVGSTERALASTNFKHRDRLPEEAIVDYGRRRLLEGYDRVFLGHFHEPRVWRLPEGEIHVLDAWFRSRRIDWAHDEPLFP